MRRWVLLGGHVVMPLCGRSCRWKRSFRRGDSIELCGQVDQKAWAALCCKQLGFWMFGFGFPEVTAPLAPASAPSCYQTSRLFNCATGGTLACPRLGRAALFDPGPADGDQFIQAVL